MPLTGAQARVLKLLAAHRTPDSYLAGATVIHRNADTPRYSQDLDFFHDVEDAVAQSSAEDAATLTAAGYDLEWLFRAPTFHRAVVTVGDERLKLEWAQDSAFRFFPVETDPVCGYRLHVADAATGKLLALAGRVEPRDFVDVVYLHGSFLSLGGLAWATCGKDPGYTPGLLLEHANRHACHSQEAIDRLSLREPLSIRGLKALWIEAVDSARRLVALLPPGEIGCLYLGPDGCVVTPDPESADFPGLRRHYGSVRGAWPTVSPHTSIR